MGGGISVSLVYLEVPILGDVTGCGMWLQEFRMLINCLQADLRRSWGQRHRERRCHCRQYSLALRGRGQGQE